MNIKIITYVDNKKLLSEKYDGIYIECDKKYILEYTDKNKKKYKIVIDKNKDNVSIIKEGNSMDISGAKSLSVYGTDYGVINLETKLLNVEKLERNNFVRFEIIYKLYFSKFDSQENKLQILININS
ncbi:DUF1934 family protein [Gemella sp. GH3]|uniref:DUF1934 family protein n=1 Tax=unclassified Gemella TaxID=2624949 RepID=UPI0015CFAEB1|nr:MULTISPECIES: DUF1934 family protein [unclassified Gemella]MBF0713761.1 DUF1934 family protein [Gemella sp. GH3.1]NYS50713.1 DUF1934 family protein [Gemella sp. GH3]